jgi:transposase InsO family protein
MRRSAGHRSHWSRYYGRGITRQTQVSATPDATDGSQRSARGRGQPIRQGAQHLSHLLRDLVIDRPSRVWAADITYIPIGRRFLYFIAIIE